MKILVLNGPNLNLTGRREPNVYGSQTMEEMLADLRKCFAEDLASSRRRRPRHGDVDTLDLL